MGRTGDIKVLVIGSDKIASYKIGLEQPLRHLEAAGACRFDVRSDEDVQLATIAAADIVIFFRTVNSGSYRFLEMAREMGKKTVYAIDDHFLAMSPTTDIGRYYHEGSKIKTYVKFLENADVVKVASEFFGEHLMTHFKPKKVVCFPGSVDFSLFEGLRKRSNHEGKLVIGYEGGKKQTAFDPVIGALERVLRRYGDRLRIEFFGYIPESLAGKPQVSFDRHQWDYRNFLKRLYCSDWDIGLAPLERTLLHDCKTNNKFREYGACRIPGIYSLAPAYEGWVKNKQNGILVARSKDDWYEAMIELAEQPVLRRRLKDNAEATAREHFSVSTCAERWRTQILTVE